MAKNKAIECVQEDPLKCDYPSCDCMSMQRIPSIDKDDGSDTQLNISVKELKNILKSSDMSVDEFLARLSQLKSQDYNKHREKN